MINRIVVGLLSVVLAAPLFAATERVDPNTKRIEASASVLREILAAGDRSIPHDLLEKASCVGVVPGLKRAGFVFGGEYGKGVVTCRTRGPLGWSAPSTIRIEGGSIGFQIGLGETDLVFIVMNHQGMNKLMSDKFTVGGDASVMAGPVGRSAAAETDALMSAEILAYSRAHGVFAGVSLDGATLRPDKDANWTIYGRQVSQRDILEGRVRMPASARPLARTLDQYAPFKKTT